MMITVRKSPLLLLPNAILSSKRVPFCFHYTLEVRRSSASINSELAQHSPCDEHQVDGEAGDDDRVNE